MGVTGLWSLLSSVKTNVSLTECEGKRLAVDLSAWLVQLQCTSSSFSERYICYRGIFFKTLKLLSLGISLIFVMDGPVPPLMKRNRKTRDLFYQSSLQYKELLLSMGIPVIESAGEAEKLCAELNRKKIVDGIITDDSDVFIYGGQTVYRGVFSKNKERFAEKYQLKDIISTLGLTQRDLVAYALMNHGDLTNGIPNVGEKTFIKLMKEFRSNHIEDALNRLMSWRNNTELLNLEIKKQEIINLKINLCSKCHHEGSKNLHTKEGCRCCQSIQTCHEVSNKDHPVCTCQRHSLGKQFIPYVSEMKIRTSALQADPNFPNPEIIKEYLQIEQSLEESKMQISWPDFPKMHSILKSVMKLPSAQLMKHILPAYIKLALCGIVPMNYAQPLGILTSHTEAASKCFSIKWKISDLDDYIVEDDKCLVISIPEHMFTPRYPEMAKKYSPPKDVKKRKHELAPDQRKITEYFKMKHKSK